MNKISFVFSSLLLMVSTRGIAATLPSENGDLSRQPLAKVAPFPAAEKGMVRQVIYLPKQENEDNFKVELLIGKIMTVDCNRPMIGGTLESKTLAGWGYDYWVLTKLSPPASTMMACADNSKRQEFVAARLGNATMQRYNSKLPLVIYVPKGVEVRYRIWSASETVERAVVK